ncbi:hypothetical protein FRC17_005085 [Serendipita sp. 399]|nr:hypothetical protein FRC17_005085 [Serendipita sp. 399]
MSSSEQPTVNNGSFWLRCISLGTWKKFEIETYDLHVLSSRLYPPAEKVIMLSQTGGYGKDFATRISFINEDVVAAISDLATALQHAYAFFASEPWLEEDISVLELQPDGTPTRRKLHPSALLSVFKAILSLRKCANALEERVRPDWVPAWQSYDDFVAEYTPKIQESDEYYQFSFSSIIKNILTHPPPNPWLKIEDIEKHSRQIRFGMPFLDQFTAFIHNLLAYFQQIVEMSAKPDTFGVIDLQALLESRRRCSELVRELRFRWAEIKSQFRFGIDSERYQYRE